MDIPLDEAEHVSKTIILSASCSLVGPGGFMRPSLARSRLESRNGAKYSALRDTYGRMLSHENDLASQASVALAASSLADQSLDREPLHPGLQESR